MDDRAAAEHVGRVETLLAEVEALPDPAARETATTLAGALLDLYGEGLARVVAVIAERDGDELADALAADELVSHLLLLHGLHPVPLEARVRQALEGVRPYLESHGGDVELLGVDGGAASLRLEGSCDGCPSSAVTLRSAIEEAIFKAAPDIERVDAVGLAEAPPAGPGPRRSWARTGALPPLAEDELLVRDVEGDRLLFLALGARPYAYRSDCPACGASLGDGVLAGTELRCGGCDTRFDVRRAGRCLDDRHLHLEPVPLLTAADGGLKVAIATVAVA